MDEEQLLAALSAQEQLRGVVPDEVIDAAISALGSQLEGMTGRAQRRRQVTVLFADVSGFTAMSESLDPEIVAELMNELWARLDRVVVDRGGRVDKHIGDALMAVWGTEATAEDDAERAVRASLGLQSEIAKFRVSSGRDLAMRIGVNTGPVLVGPVGSTREFTVMGDAVNTASRLEHAAPPNGVVISHDTYSQIRGVFDVEALQPLTVKGKAEPLRAYVVKAAKARAFRLRSRGVEGVETSTVGREEEFAALCRAFHHVVSAGRCQSVVVVGDAGVGKSRLLYEFDNWLELHDLGVFYFKARAIRSRSESRLGLWRDLVAFRAGVKEGDSPAMVLEKLRAETAPVLDDREALILGLWLGFELSDGSSGAGVVSGENLAAVGRAHLVAFFRSLMAASPVVMLFEDLHWADEESLELLRDLVSQFSEDQLLTVAATRPERSGSGSVLDALGPTWTAIPLASLDEPAARALVAEILKRVDHVPEPLVDLVVERADGNPFYIEELIKKLMDDGCIVADGEVGTWTVRVDLLDAATIPKTLTGVLQARFDVLSEAGRRSLQRASILGRTFWDSAVEALGPEPADLEAALSSEMVFQQRPSSFAQTAEFTFKHALLHDVAYETVLLSERRALHERAAEWLALVVAERRDEYLEEIAGHLLLADQMDQAAELLFEAAERALNSGDASSARRLADAGFRASGAAASNSSWHLILARACRLVGDLATADEAVRLAIQLGERNADDAAIVAATHEAFFVSELLGAHERGRSLVERALPIATRLGGINLTRMLTCSALSDLNSGNLKRAKQNAAATLSRAKMEGDTKTLIGAHLTSGRIAQALGDHDETLAHDRRIFELATESGDLTGLAICHLNLGVSWHYLADLRSDIRNYERAQAEYEEALVLTRRLGLRAYEVRSLVNLAQLLMRTNQTVEAHRLAKECLAVAVAIGAHADSLFAILVHAEAEYELTGSPGALSHIGVVRSDPALGRLAAEVADVIDRLRRSHPEADMDQALDAGASLMLDDVVRDIIDEEDH